MKYSVGMKFIAILLCACCLVAVAFSGIGIAFMEGYDLYSTSLESVHQSQIDRIGKVCREAASRVGTAADAGADRIGQMAGHFQELFTGFFTDAVLEVANHHREGVRTEN